MANTGARNDIVALLHSHSATAGLLDAKERFDAPKCDEGTRTSMILEMKKFVQDGDEASSSAVYWLHGPAGVGKSALAQSLSLSLKGESDHAASFFFSRTSPGRNDGNRLILTLAYQLAMNFPTLHRFMSKVVKTNPGILTASNSVQMKDLIVDPINKWHRKYKWSIQRWTDRLNNAKTHPRLVLVDGLDECSDTDVQTDIILCIASAVRELTIPLRFVIASRPESHILAAFELDPAFQGFDGVSVTKKNLGDDKDADEQITTYLLKQFAEIRRVHPVRDFLPQQWPRPHQIRTLVLKSSKGFIYPATVIRYIKMPHNRPDECLDRILGLSEIPTSDKPYEPLDCLYRHIFDSVPVANKPSIRNIFHFLLLPSTLDYFTESTAFVQSLDSTAVIEELFKYPRGHVQHVLKDLLCLVEVSINHRDSRIKILHASLPDFLYDKSRSGPLCITASDVHAAIAAAYLSHTRLTDKLRYCDSHCDVFLKHLMKANVSNTTLHDSILHVDLLSCYREICSMSTLGLHAELCKWYTVPLQAEIDIRSIAFMVAYLLALLIRNGALSYIREQIFAIKSYILQIYPPAASARTLHEEIIPFMIPLFNNWTSTIYHEYTKQIFSAEVIASHNELRGAIFELHFLMMVPLYQDGASSSNLTDCVEMEKLIDGHPEEWIKGDLNYWANIVLGSKQITGIAPSQPSTARSITPEPSTSE